MSDHATLESWVFNLGLWQSAKVLCSDNEKIAEITCVINQEMEARISVAIEAVAADLRYCYGYGVVKLDGWLLIVT